MTRYPSPGEDVPGAPPSLRSAAAPMADVAGQAESGPHAPATVEPARATAAARGRRTAAVVVAVAAAVAAAAVLSGRRWQQAGRIVLARP
jgi:hypothetical protein